MRLYAAVKALREKGPLPAANRKNSADFVKLSLPSVVREVRVEIKKKLPNGRGLWMNIAEAQLPVVLRALSAWEVTFRPSHLDSDFRFPVVWQ